jgi:hypothetical protein
MPSFLADNAHYLLLAIIGVWFAARFLVMSRGGRRKGGLAALFRREGEVMTKGLGEPAIRTLLDDSRDFARGRPDLRGLVLAGPFAAGTASPKSRITLIFLAEAPSPYASPEALGTWAYPGRGHVVTADQIETDGDVVLRHLVLRGAPPVDLAFVPANATQVPAALVQAVTTGVKPQDDPTGQAAALALAWREAVRR